MIAIVGLGVLGTRVLKALKQKEEVLLVDYDFVREENIPSQYPEVALSKSKVEASKELFHPAAQVLHEHLDATSVGVLEDCELVIDCTDNMLARRVINDFCSREGIPWIHSGLSDTAGTVATFVAHGPCFSCVYPAAVGENCTAQLHLAIADATADAVIEAIPKLRQGVSTFVRIDKKGELVLSMQHRKDCKTCKGIYEYLTPRDFYITYCENSECMAAKPAKHVHDHGKPVEMEVQGMPLELFPNGEIHFGKDADDDTLYQIATAVYKQR